MRLFAMHGESELVDMACFAPFHSQVGVTIDIPCFLHLVEHDDGDVLFDNDGHPQLIDERDDELISAHNPAGRDKAKVAPGAWCE